MIIRAALKPICLIIPAMLALTGCSVVPQPRIVPEEPAIITTQRPDIDPPPRNDRNMRQVMIMEHNRTRAKWGVAPLMWDDALARNAQSYGDELARSGRFEHADQSGAGLRQGENLWKGTSGAFSYAEMVGGWIDEDRFFKRGIFPDNSTSGQWRDVGHYTAIIWRQTTRFGCAVSRNRSDEYLVCRYSPAGNIVGRDPLAGAD